ncbi:MAG: hypothetical protein K2Y22_02245 [Candidatus Obscuribacterales bacterium]|nr:hypothetical protein [Candidatus Obscuribacterales bacterium]
MPQNNPSKLTQIQLNRLITHESSAVKSRIEALPEKINPILVKPLQEGDLFYVINGTNRVCKAQQAGQKSISCIVATPDFSSRMEKIARARLGSDRTIPIAETDTDRQHQFYLDTDHFTSRVSTKSDRGTIVRAMLEIQIGDQIYSHFSLPLKGSLGGIVFDPTEFLKHCNAQFIDSDKLLSCWGDDNKYDPRVLPSYLEISDCASDISAGGFLLRQAFWKEKYANLESNTPIERGQVQTVSLLVIYPNGLVWEGPINYKVGETYAVLWSDHLLRAMKDPNLIQQLTAEPHWWKKPPYIVLNKD